MKPYSLHIVSHTHWDREWYLNSPYVNEWLVPFFDSLFAMIARRPGYRFILDGQASMIDDWIAGLAAANRDQEAEKSTLSRYVREGRIIVGPYYLQLDWNLASPETLVRNLALGMESVSGFGPSMKTGWLLDNFGQTGQTAQIHAGFGIDSIFMWRGAEVDSRSLKTEFWWESQDGTKALTVLLLGSYRNAMRLGTYSSIAAERLVWEKRKLSAFTTTPNAVLMNGYDQEMDPDDVLGVLETCPELPGIVARQSTPAEYVQAVREHAPELVTRSGALYGGRYIAVFPGVLSARNYLKLRNDEVSTFIERSLEPLLASCAVHGVMPLDAAGKLDSVWKELLRNQPHDSICGVSVDPVHKDMEERFDRVEVMSRSLFEEAAACLVSRLHQAERKSGAGSDPGMKRGDCAGPVCLVVNPAPVSRNMVVDLDVGEACGDFRIVDGEGNRLVHERSGAGKVRVLVPAVEGCGLRVLRVLAGQSETSLMTGHAGAALPGRDAEELVSVEAETFRMWTGRFSVRVHGNGTWDLQDAAGVLVAPGAGYFVDEGDAGDEYDFSPCGEVRGIDSRDFPHTVRFEETGRIRAVIRIETVIRVPERLGEDRNLRSSGMVEIPVVTRLIAEAGNPTLGIDVQFRNRARDHRLRMLFPAVSPAGIFAGSAFAVDPLGVAEPEYSESDLSAEAAKIVIGARAAKPVGMRPVRDFVTLGTGAGHVDVHLDGLHEGEALGDGSFAVTLVRAVGWLARSDLKSRIGDAGPLMATPDAQCLRDFHCTLGLSVRSSGAGASPSVESVARRWNPLLIQVAPDSVLADEPDGGRIPCDSQASGSWMSGLELTGEGRRLIPSALKPAMDGRGIILRVWNPERVPVAAVLSVPERIASAEAVDLAESPAGLPLELRDGRVAFEAGAGSIVSIRLVPLSVSGAEPEHGVESDGAGDMDQAGKAGEAGEAGACDGRKGLGLEVTTGVQRIGGNLDPADFSNWPLHPAAGTKELEEESARADQVEKLWSEALTRYREAESAGVGELGLRKLELAEASWRRTKLEARISAILLRRHCIQGWSDENDRDELRTLGYELNLARIDKRALEYVVECLENQPAVRAGGV